MAKGKWKKFKSDEVRAHIKKKKRAARDKKYNKSKKGKQYQKQRNKKLRDFRKRRAAWWKKYSWPGAPPFPG